MWDARACPGAARRLGGRTEFIEKYFEVVADLRRRGFAVASMDWRGQGGSQRMLANPRKGNVRGFWEYDRDLIRFMKDIVLPDCPPPFIGPRIDRRQHSFAQRRAGLWFSASCWRHDILNSQSIIGPGPSDVPLRRARLHPGYVEALASSAARTGWNRPTPSKAMR
jgi:hypothetical protein